MNVETRFTRTLALLREICLALPESSEKLAWGHPTFRAGKKIFASLGTYDGEVCFGFKPDEATYRRLVEDPRCFIPPYVGHLGWLSMRISASPRSLRGELKELCEQSYRQFALKRMLAALDGDEPPGPSAPGPSAKEPAVARKRRASRKP